MRLILGLWLLEIPFSYSVVHVSKYPTYPVKPAMRVQPTAIEPQFSDTTRYLGTTIPGALPPTERPHNMKRRYFDWEYVFDFIWQHCDGDGLWDGDAASVAAEFHVPEDEAHEVLSDLTDRGLIEPLLPGKFAIANWRERDHSGEEEDWA
jgi:hypothetical protein